MTKKTSDDTQTPVIDMQKIMDRTVDDILDGGDSPIDGSEGKIDDESESNALPSDEDATLDESPSETEDEEGETAPDATEDAEEPGEVDEADDVENEYEPITEDGFVVQGEEEPLLYAGQDEKGKEVYLGLEEVLGDAKFKLKAAGSMRELTIAELKNGYQRGADYTQEKTRLAERDRAMAPYARFVDLLRTDDKLQGLVMDYINGVEIKDDLESRLDDAIESGDTEQIKQLRKAKREKEEARARVQAANQVQRQQAVMMMQENQRVATSLIPDYTNSMSRVRQYLTSQGFDEQSVKGIEYLDPKLQRIFYTAALLDGQDSNSGKPPSPPKRVLRGKKRQIVRRPPKAPRPGTARSTSASAKSNASKAKFKRAYATGNTDDIAAALESMIPDDMVE